MKFLEKKPFICLESRGSFVKQIFRWTVIHSMSLILPIALFYYGFENDRLDMQFYALAFFLAYQCMLITLLDRIVNFEGRILDIHPEAPKFCNKHFGVIVLVPVLSIVFIGYLCLKKRTKDKVPWLIANPGRLALMAMSIFIFTVITPLLSLLYPVRLEVFNYWISTPGAYSISQTVGELRKIGARAKNPEVLEMSDLNRTDNTPFYVSALTFEMVSMKLLNDLNKIQTRAIGSEGFDYELNYLENLCELIKWSDNSKTMFAYSHSAFTLPTSGWDSSLAFMAEQYFLTSFKLQIHNEAEHYFHELGNNLKESTQKEKLKSLEDVYRASKSARALTQLKGTWLAKIF